MNIKVTGLQHIGIPTKKMSESLNFYHKLGFATAFSMDDGMACVHFLELGNLVIELYGDPDAVNDTGAINHIAINCLDIDEAFKKIKANGLKMLSDSINFLPFWENGVKFFIIEGPNAEKIEYCQYL